jgi:energy-converting hydrogenase Eha subunit H
MIERQMKIKGSHYLKQHVTKRCLNLLYLLLNLKDKIEIQTAEIRMQRIKVEIQDQTTIEALAVVATLAAVVAVVN